MDPSAAAGTARGLMQGFAERTGLDPVSPSPQRYLWTDAFAVCNYLGLGTVTRKPACLEQATRLISQVHHTLGRFRSDDPRQGWISGLPDGEGELHPAIGGLRIGKTLPERGPGEPPDKDREWDQDGQYFHYLTRWMHALAEASRITGDPRFLGWSVELARTAAARFVYPGDGRTMMYWKMSTDLTQPLVRSMGQHDPLDGMLTFADLRQAVVDAGGTPVLDQEIALMAEMAGEMPLATDDPLGTGGLLADLLRIARLSGRGVRLSPALAPSVMSAARHGLASFQKSRTLALPAGYRLAFRELGLAIGLAAVEYLPTGFPAGTTAGHGTGAFRSYLPLRETITAFWMDERNQASATWIDHREINTVMLATALFPDGYLGTGPAIPDSSQGS